MEVQNKQFEVFKWVLVLAALYMVYKLLNKFGLLGTSPDDKGAAQLANSDIFNPNSGVNNKVVVAAAKATGVKNPNVNDFKKIVPNQKYFSEWTKILLNARGLTNDNEASVFGVFNNMYSQFEIKMFSDAFSIALKKNNLGTDLWSYLDNFLDSSDMAKINEIIKRKKVA